ncbi:hypothetical protein J2S31_002702 [Nitrospina gracilis Nb-211]|nr:hypothetical protein [Nitrospina gracilis Nb-211]
MTLRPGLAPDRIQDPSVSAQGTVDGMFVNYDERQGREGL